MISKARINRLLDKTKKAFKPDIKHILTFCSKCYDENKEPYYSLDVSRWDGIGGSNYGKEAEPALRFKTKDEAEAYLHELSEKYKGVKDFTMVCFMDDLDD